MHRFKKNSELELRLPVSDENLPAAMAVRGIESTTDGIDYRGASVIAAMKKVPGSGWFLVTKIDKNEILKIANIRYLVRKFVQWEILLILGILKNY